MKPTFAVLALLTFAQPAFAQGLVNNSRTLNVTGDAAITVVPDRVRLFMGVESRNKDLLAAKAENDAGVRRVIEAARALKIAPADIQTDYIHVDMAYDGAIGTIVNHYRVTKDIQILLRDVQQFEELLSQVLIAGANHIYDVEFSTSELRRHRDAARALAIKAAQEKANDLAAAAGLKVGAPLGVNAYNYGGGTAYSYRRFRGGQMMSQMTQNATQISGSDDSGIGSDGTVALGKVSVTASVSMSFQLEPK